MGSRHLGGIALVLAALTFSAGAGLVPPAARPATGRTAVPDVAGLDLPHAYAQLHRLGLAVSIHDPFALDVEVGPCPQIVARQWPAAGSPIPADRVAVLNGRPTPCAKGSPGVPLGPLPSYTVPDFRRQSVGAAIAWAERRNLDWQAALPALVRGRGPALAGDYRVSAQDPRPGSAISVGVKGPDSFRVTPLSLRGRPAR